jgi:hypothetical protein
MTRSPPADHSAPRRAVAVPDDLPCPRPEPDRRRTTPITSRSACGNGQERHGNQPSRFGDMGALIRWRMLCSSRWVIPGLAEGVTGWLAGRRQPVFGRPSASGEKWPALTAAGGRACQCDRAGSGVRARPRRTGAAAANTRATQVRVQEASNTRATRTKRHSPAHLGTGVKIVVSAQLPGWMRSSWADWSILTRWHRERQTF